MPSDFMLDKGIRMRIKLKNAEIQEYVNAPASEFPKYTTQLMNIANQNSQATRPRHVVLRKESLCLQISFLLSLILQLIQPIIDAFLLQ